MELLPTYQGEHLVQYSVNLHAPVQFVANSQAILVRQQDTGRLVSCDRVKLHEPQSWEIIDHPYNRIYSFDCLDQPNKEIYMSISRYSDQLFVSFASFEVTVDKVNRSEVKIDADKMSGRQNVILEFIQ